MKAYERRECGAYPYFKLDAWDARFGMWRPHKGKGPRRFATEADARAACLRGRYRVMRVDDGRTSLSEPFEV